MSISPRDLGDQWQGMEPEQPPSSRAAFWVALVAMLLLLLGAGALAVFLVSQDQTDPTELIAGGDDGGGAVVIDGGTVEPTVAVPATEALDDAATSIAPTVTLPGLPPAAGPVTAGRLPTTPTIDADLSEWAGVPTWTSDSIVFTAPTWDGSDDLTATWQLGWDEFNLYVAASVLDDIHAQNQTGNTIFRGDSLDMQFDTNRAADFGPDFSPDDFQITLSPGDFAGLPPSAFRFQGTANGEMLDAPSFHNILMAARPQPGGYTLEAAIPWRDLNVTPFAGLELGLALNASDNDQPGSAVQEVMKSNAPNRTFGDPTTWGVLVLQ